MIKYLGKQMGKLLPKVPGCSGAALAPKPGVLTQHDYRY